MKKLLFTVLMVSFITSMYSQVTFKPGVRLGLNLASISNFNDGSRTDFHAGIFGELRLGDVYALQPEINYSKQGSEHFEFDYLSIRIMNKFYILSEDTPLFISISPGFDINLHGKTESYSSDYGAGVNFDADLSFTGGIGYEFPFGLGVEARYKKGITDVFMNYDHETKQRLNSVIQLSAYYKFDFGR